MFKRITSIQYEDIDTSLHPEHESRNTRVSEYLRKYGQGKIDSMPVDHRPTVNDTRSVDDMLDSEYEPSLSTEHLDVLLELERKKEDFIKMNEDIEFTTKQRESFDAAVKVVNDSNSSYDDKLKAYEVLEELEKQAKVIRARN